jgi:hypothetical protein
MRQESSRNIIYAIVSVPLQEMGQSLEEMLLGGEICSLKGLN